MTLYSIGKVAKMSGVTKRTLHHYHDIGLLVPAGKNPSGYRMYNSQDLLKLQQILIYRQCGLPLSDIQLILTDTRHQHIALLEHQVEILKDKITQHQSQLQTLQKTIKRLKGDKMAISDKELYDGFGENAQSIRQEAIERWGDKVTAVEEQLRSTSKNQFDATKAEGESIAKALSALLNLDKDAHEVQQLVKRQLKWLNNFYPVSKAQFVGLANLYVEDDRFRQFYDKYAQGTANLFRDAMLYYAENNQW